ncbi:MAG: bifunctional adenosylcobinamide kinase/adenosylcobinamide-phosphate guanylyltransferase [Oscillospiraceae bacterium]|nr:bifunctional adenosylcobinamide kinase/adenosylcobinamide-phosphate guanylyltransferase [Oscillospiraceae bacterium]
MMILLTGGSACGKSSYAEKLCMSLPLPRYYIAAMRPYGDGSKKKIARHREMRSGKGFETVERYTDLAGLSLPEKGTVLLECICNLTANEMFDSDGNMRDPVSTVLEGVSALKSRCSNLIVVTNDVGSETPDLSDEAEGTRAYVRALGAINAALAREADAVYELVCGIPLPLKGVLPE